MATLSTARKLSEPWLLISDYEKIAEHALAMLKAVYLREGPTPTQHMVCQVHTVNRKANVRFGSNYRMFTLREPDKSFL